MLVTELCKSRENDCIVSHFCGVGNRILLQTSLKGTKVHVCELSGVNVNFSTHFENSNQDLKSKSSAKDRTCIFESRG